MELPKRKPTRLKNFDYSKSGAYFITICTKNRKQLLGKIVGYGDFDVPHMNLSEYGEILDKYIKLMNNKYLHLKIDKYIIMPNHLHLILKVVDYVSGASGTAAPYNSEISKFVSLLKRHCNIQYGNNIWQRSYHDHIIRGDEDYRKIWEYINTNVLKWEQDCFYNNMQT